MKRGRRSLFAPRKRKRWGCIVLPLFFVLLLLAGVFLNAANNRHPGKDTQRVSIPNLPDRLEGFRILHLSDLHGREYGIDQQKLLNLIKDDNYHAVCLTGDMVGSSGNVQPLLDLIQALPQDIPVFLVAGDEDPSPILSAPHGDASPKASWVLEAEKAGAIFLDRPVKMEFNKSTLWLCPADLFTMDLEAAEFALADRQTEILSSDNPQSPENGAALRVVEYQMDVMEQVKGARSEMLPEHFYIALAHAPLGDDALILAQQSIEGKATMTNFPGQLSLILAGHFNAGHVHLPVLGPVFAPPSALTGEGGFMPDKALLFGVRSVRGVAQYITPGLGTSVIYPKWLSFRLFNPPEISLLILTGQFF